jgi:hypothetical protein
LAKRWQAENSEERYAEDAQLINMSGEEVHRFCLWRFMRTPFPLDNVIGIVPAAPADPVRTPAPR